MSNIESILLRWGVVALIGAALFGSGYVYGLRHADADNVQFRQGVAVTGAAQNAHTAATIGAQTGITNQTEKSYVQGNNAMRALYGPGRVRDTSTDSSSGKLPAVPGAAGQSDAVTANAGSGTGVPGTDQCAGLRSDSAVTTRQLLYLQDWIRQQQALQTPVR